jgi:Tfp pilus assembly protein PilO
MNSSFKPQTLITVVALILVVVITYVLALPQSNNLKKNRATLAAKQAEEKALTEKIDSLTALGEKLPQYEGEINKLIVAFPQEPQQVEALIQAKVVAEKAGLTAAGLVPGVAAAGNLPIAMSLQGGADRLITLFKEINENLRPIKIDTISLLSGSKESNGVMNINVGAGFLYNAAAGTTPAEPGTTPAADEALPTAN